MAGRPRIYEEVDETLAKDELVRIACDLYGPPFDDREPDNFDRASIREIGRAMKLSEVKVKKLLIEGGYYSTKETRKVANLQRKGLSLEEISVEMGISLQKVKTLTSYKNGRVYGIGTNSAKRNEAYRKRRMKGYHE